MKKIKEIKTGAFRPSIDTIGMGLHSKVMGKSSPATGADSWFSRYSQSPPNIVIDDELESDDEDIILECRVFKRGKYMLVETLANISEDYASEFKNMFDKIQNASSRRKDAAGNLETLDDMLEDLDLDDEEKLDEFSVAVPGVAVPMGYTSKGKPETKEERKRRQKFNVTKSYPYKLPKK